eukprot:4865040-Pyramimonas_sp.AAC.1
MFLLNASRPSLVQLTMYRQWLFANHVVCTAHGNPERPALEDLGQGIFSQEPMEPDILCSTSVAHVPSTPAPVRNRRQQISYMKRVVRQRCDSAAFLEDALVPLPARERA